MMKSVKGIEFRNHNAVKGLKKKYGYKRSITESCTRCEHSVYKNNRYTCPIVDDSVYSSYKCIKFERRIKPEKVKKKKPIKFTIQDRQARDKTIAMGKVDNPINKPCHCIRSYRKITKIGKSYFFRDTKAIHPRRHIYQNVKGNVSYLFSIWTRNFNKYFEVV